MRLTLKTTEDEETIESQARKRSPGKAGAGWNEEFSEQAVQLLSLAAKNTRAMDPKKMFVNDMDIGEAAEYLRK